MAIIELKGESLRPFSPFKLGTSYVRCYSQETNDHFSKSCGCQLNLFMSGVCQEFWFWHRKTPGEKTDGKEVVKYQRTNKGWSCKNCFTKT